MNTARHELGVSEMGFDWSMRSSLIGGVGREDAASAFQIKNRGRRERFPNKK
jgi:hypothetical protein